MADSCGIAELKETIEKGNSELNQLRTKISELNAKVREQEECLSTAQTEMSNLREENAQAQTEMSNLREENTQAQTEMSNLREENAQAQTEISNLREEKAQAQTEISNLREENVQAQTEISNLREENALLASSLKEVQDCQRCAEDRIKKLERLLREKETELIRVQDCQGRAGHRIQKLEQQLTEKETKLIRVQDCQGRAGHRIQKLEQQLTEKETELIRVQDCQRRAGDRIQKLEQQLTEEETELIRSEEKCWVVQERLDLAEKKLAQFLEKTVTAAEECLAQISFPLVEKDGNSGGVKYDSNIKHLLKRKKPDEETKENNVKTIKLTSILEGGSKEMTPSPMTLLLVTCSKTGDDGNSQGASLTKVLGPTTSQVIQSPQEIVAMAAGSQPQQMIGVLNPDRTITLVTSLGQPEATNVHVIGNVATALKSLSTIATAQKVTNWQVSPQRTQIIAGSPGNITYKATPAQQIHNTRIDDKKAICIPAGLPQTFQLAGKHIFTPTGQTFLQPQGVQVPTSIQNGGQALLDGITQIGGQNVTIRQSNVMQTLKLPIPVQQTFPVQIPTSSVNGQPVLQTVHVPVQTNQSVPRASILHSQGQPLTVNVPAPMVIQLSNMGHIAQADNHVSKLPIPKRLHTPHKPYMRYRPKVKEQNEDALYINSLPNEIILKIFAFLKHNQLGQIARVCRRWNVLIKSPILWKKVDVEFSSSHESQTDIAKSFVNQLPSCVSSLSLNFAFYDDWNELLYFEKLCIKLKKKVPHLERLILDNAILSDTLPTVIDLCSRHLQNIQVLVFRFCMSPDGPARIKYGDVSKIELLDVSCCNFGHVNKLPFSRMPNLKRLFLGGDYVNDSWFENDNSFFNQLHILNLAHTEISSRTFRAIQNHAFNLQELYLCFTDIKDDDISSSNSMFLHLKTICLVYCHGVTSNGISSLIQSCQSLQNVYVDEEVAESYAVHPSVIDSRYMLEIVKGRDIFHSHYFSHK